MPSAAPLALELDQDAFLGRLGADRLGLEHDVVEARRVHLLPDLDQVAVGALHQAVQHFDHVQARAQRGIDRAHFQADDAAAQDQHALRDWRNSSAPVESTTRGSSFGMKGSFTASEPAAMMACLNLMVCLLAGLLLRGPVTFDLMVGIEELARSRAPP